VEEVLNCKVGTTLTVQFINNSRWKRC